MKKALVLGASGGMGYSLVQELVAREIETVAFAKTRTKLERLFGANSSVSIFDGNAYEVQDIIKAGQGAEVIFHTVSIPYPDWTEGHPAIMRNVIQAARELQAKVVLIDNIYAYGRGPGRPVTEEDAKHPHTKKGKIRLSIEQMAKEAHQEGVPTLIAHFPDFYGPNADNTILGYTLQAMAAGKSAMFVGPQGVQREYIFTPDGAKAAVELALREECYGQNWNIPGYGVISGQEIVSLARKLTGYTGKVRTVTKGMITFLGLFDKMMREMQEMMYLTEEPVVLSGKKYESRIGRLPSTPYEEGLRRTLQFMKGEQT
jgi:nucleoside-diphosphate-sugar epimerase